MAQTRTSYHKEVKTASFQGRTITVENLPPILAPKVRDKRKREIEAGALHRVPQVRAGPGGDALTGTSL